MYYQKEVAAQMIENSADYVLDRKENQSTLHGEVKLFF